MSVTIRDVARRAGVSISTVSRVLNGSSPVSEEKQALVTEAAEALGYHPNPAALSLLNKRTGALGVLLPFMSGEFFSELLGGLDEAAQELGQSLVVSSSHSRPDDFGRAASILHKRVDGLLVMAPELGAAGASQLAASDAPVVFLNTDAAPDIAADFINFDNYGGARAATEHLIGLGHRRLTFVDGPASAWDAQERARGFREAAHAAGLGDRIRVVQGGYTREAGFAAAQTLLGTGPLPTGIVAANDYGALGVMSALHEAGIRVPHEVSVCGFDGLPSGAFALPPLTTARVPVRELGARAVRLLLSRIGETERAPTFRRDVVPVEFLARASTAPPTS
jgi:LacI family transcriptional regulator